MRLKHPSKPRLQQHLRHKQPRPSFPFWLRLGRCRRRLLYLLPLTGRLWLAAGLKRRIPVSALEDWNQRLWGPRTWVQFLQRYTQWQQQYSHQRYIQKFQRCQNPRIRRQL